MRVRAGGSDSDQVVAAVAALELVQASALIHDDLMDRSDTQRGEPAQVGVGDVLPELRATATGIEADLHIAGRFRRVRPS